MIKRTLRWDDDDERLVDANKTTTPRTDARLGQIKIENEDSCCAIYVYIDGKEYYGDLVDADFARQLESELAEANARLEQKVNDSADFVEGMIIMERIRARRGYKEEVNVMNLLVNIQNEIRRPIVCLEVTK